MSTNSEANTNQQEQKQHFSVKEITESRNAIVNETTSYSKDIAAAFSSMPSDNTKELITEAALKIDSIAKTSGSEGEEDSKMMRMLKGTFPSVFGKLSEKKIEHDVSTKTLAEIGEDLEKKINQQIESAKKSILAVAELAQGVKGAIPTLDTLCEQIEAVVDDPSYTELEQQQLKLILIETKADKNRLTKLYDDCRDQMNFGSNVVANMMHRLPQIRTQFIDEAMILEGLDRIDGLQKTGEAVDALIDGMATRSTEASFDVKERILQRKIDGEGVRRIQNFTNRFEERSKNLKKLADEVPQAIDKNLKELTRQEGVLEQRGETISLLESPDTSVLLPKAKTKE